MAIIIFGAVYSIFLLIFAVVLGGKGDFLIIGYKAMPKEKKERYNEKTLCRCAIWLFFGTSYGIALIPTGVQIKQPWLVCIGIALAVLLPVGVLIYANTGGRLLLGKTTCKRNRRHGGIK